MFSKLYQIDRWLIVVAVIVSLALSLWGNIVDDIVNNDGIEYIKSAQAILQGDWLLAIQTYKWPFYSSIMAFISAASGLSLENSAYLFNAICYAWLVLAFIALVHVLGGNRTTLWFAVLVILAFPTLNKFRPYLIRDPAFYALFLSGCYAFFVYIKYGQLKYNLIAIICFTLGALFRVEGAIYLFVTQAYLLNQHLFVRVNRTVGILVVFALLLVIIVLISWWQFSPKNDLTYLSIFSSPVQFMETAWIQVFDQISRRLHAIDTKVLVGYSRGYSAIVLVWSAMTIVFSELIHSLYYLYFVLWFVAWRKKLLFPVTALYRPWRYIIVIALFILLSFVGVKWFLSERYPLTVSLLLLLATPFLLAHWYEKVTFKGTHKRVFYGVMALVILSGIKSVDLQTNKLYLKQAGYWMAENIPSGKTVYSNNRILTYYFGRKARNDQYWHQWKFFKRAGRRAKVRYDYAAIQIHHKNPGYIDRLPHTLKSKVVATFVNDKGSLVYVIDFSQQLQSDWPKLRGE